MCKSGRKDCSKTVNVSGMNESLNGVRYRDGHVSEKISERGQNYKRSSERKKKSR